MVVLANARCVGLADRRVLRIRLEQLRKRDLRLIAELSGKLVRRQVVEERIIDPLIEQRSVGIAQLRIHQVELPGVGKIAADVAKVGRVNHELLHELPLQRHIETIVHVRPERGKCVKEFLL